MATKFAAPYIQSFLNIMKTQFGVELMVFGGYLDNEGTVNTFKYVLLFFPPYISVDNILIGNKLFQRYLQMVS
jgi:hypothetical protein